MQTEPEGSVLLLILAEREYLEFLSIDVRAHPKFDG
jgi:hypothetical protein